MKKYHAVGMSNSWQSSVQLDCAVFFFFLGGGGVFDYPEDLLPGTILVLLLRQLDLR